MALAQLLTLQLESKSGEEFQFLLISMTVTYNLEIDPAPNSLATLRMLSKLSLPDVMYLIVS